MLKPQHKLFNLDISIQSFTVVRSKIYLQIKLNKYTDTQIHIWMWENSNVRAVIKPIQY